MTTGPTNARACVGRHGHRPADGQNGDRWYPPPPMAKQSARKKAGLGPPPRRTPAPPVRSKGAPGGRAQSRPPWLPIAVGAAVLALVGIGLAIALTRGGSGTSSLAPIPWAQIPGLQSGAPPWDNSSAVLRDRLPLLHLDALGAEGEVLHIHEHLDVYVNGKKVSVPALIGIDTANQFLTQLHTHDASGIVHVESPTKRNFDLGEFFGEWGVKLTGRCLGSYCGHLHWWVSGQKMTGNPAQLVLKAHQEIVIAAGTPPSPVPSSYKFPAGL
jgi:hypothetical protein